MSVTAERPVLLPEYMYADESAKYIRSTKKKLALYRKYKLLKYGKLGKNFVYKKSWLDSFMEEWAGYDLSNEESVKYSIRAKEWRKKHGEDA